MNYIDLFFSENNPQSERDDILDNKKSTYYRLSRYTLFIIICVLVITGILTVSFASYDFRKEKLKELKSSGDIFISCIKEEYKKENNLITDDSVSLQQNICTSNGFMINVYDSYGKCILSGNNSSSDLDTNFMSVISDDEYLHLNTAVISSNEPYLLYGTKIYLKNGVSNPSEAYVLVYGDIDEIDIFSLKIALVYIIISSAGVLTAYFILKNRIHKYSEYENEFYEISEKYAKGDFTQKIDTDKPDMLKDIAEHINSLASDVETGEETSKTFIANVSHELRTPMTTIGGFVDGILDGTIKKSKQTEYLVLVSKEIQRLRMLISSMLNMTKFESGTLTPNFKETNLTDLVIQIVLMFEKKIEDKNLQIEELDSSRLMAVVDADLMQQVIYNLVENAVKFVNNGGTLSFTFEKKDGICIVGIRNTGEGLQNSEMQQVFDRFYKTDSSRGKDTTGLGLGLSISRKIVHLHNGHIVVKSVYGEYTEFQIQIPEDPRQSTDNNKK